MENYEWENMKFFIAGNPIDFIPMRYEIENNYYNDEMKLFLKRPGNDIEGLLLLPDFEILIKFGKIYYNEPGSLCIDLRDLHPYTLEILDTE